MSYPAPSSINGSVDPDTMLVSIFGDNVAPDGSWIQVIFDLDGFDLVYEGPWVARSLIALDFVLTDTRLFGRSIPYKVRTVWGTSPNALVPLAVPYPNVGKVTNGFLLFTEASPATAISIGCPVSVQLPLEHKDFSQYYTVQLDDGTYSSGTFVDPALVNLSQEVRMTLITDSTEAAAMLQQFFIDNGTFYIQCAGLDLFMDGVVGAKHKVNLIAYELDNRDGPTAWKSMLAIKKVVA